LIYDWVRDLTFPIHVGLNWRTLCAFTNSWKPYYFAKVPYVPQTYTLDVLWLQEKGAQIHLSVWSKSFTFTKNVGRVFILYSTPPTQWTLWQPH